MTNPFRRIAVTVVAASALLALSGCIKVDLAATINADDTLDGELTAAVNTEAIDAIGQAEADEFVAALTENIPGATGSRPYDDGDFVGETVGFADVPLSDFNPRETDETDDSQLRITRSDGNYLLEGDWDLPRADAGGTYPELDEEIVESAEFSVAVTFPGPVVEHNGDIDGRTVTWHLDLGQRNILYAKSGQAADSALAWWVLGITVALTLLVMLLLYLQLRRHSLRSAP